VSLTTKVQIWCAQFVEIKKIHLLRVPFTRFHPICGGQALMYEVGPKHELRLGGSMVCGFSCPGLWLSSLPQHCGGWSFPHRLSFCFGCPSLFWLTSSLLMRAKKRSGQELHSRNEQLYCTKRVILMNTLNIVCHNGCLCRRKNE
jgi:hypothetical protein